MTLGVKKEVRFLSFILLFLYLIGVAFDNVIKILALGLLVYAAWNFYNLVILATWLSTPSKHVPESWGIWDDVFYKLYHFHKRNRKAKKKLASILKRFQKSTRALPYATIVLNQSDEIEWFNAAARLLFDFHSGHDVGQRIDNLIRQPKFIRYLSLKEFDDPLEFLYEQKQILLNITPYAKGQYLLSAHDVTQGKKLDNMRRDFISNASHELRTPITVMSGYIEILRETENSNTQYPLQKIQQQTHRMEQIVAELISLAKLETSDNIDSMVTIDVSDVLNEVYQEAIALDQNRHSINLSLESVKIIGKFDELRMAFSNLLTNAIRYTNDGGHISVYVQLDESGFSVCVKDDGIGIEYEHIPRLTERFYRVDEGRSREVGGTGLGLSIVQQVLERHGGRLNIESTPGKGSVFCCTFPLTSLVEEDEHLTEL